MGANYENDVTTEAIIGCCFDVHTQIGPGFNEKIYHNALKLALEEKGIKYESEKDFPVNFKGKKVGTFRCDLFINDEVILELKAVTGILPDYFQSNYYPT